MCKVYIYIFFNSYVTLLWDYTYLCHCIILLCKSLLIWYSANSKVCETHVFYRIYYAYSLPDMPSDFINVSDGSCSDGGNNTVLLGCTCICIWSPWGSGRPSHSVIIVFSSKHLKQLNFLNVVPLHMLACILCNCERDIRSFVL